MAVSWVINPFTGALDAVGFPGAAPFVTSVAGGVGITNSPEPIVGAGTVNLDIDSLTTETALAAGDLFPFVDVSAGGTAIANQRKVTFANLVAAVNPLLDHGLLLGLTDDDHTQYLRLGGRTGGQTANGGLIAGEELTLRANAGAWDVGDEIQVFNPLNLNTGLTALNAIAEYRALNYALTATYSHALATLHVLNVQGELTIGVIPAGDAVLFRNVLTQRLSNPLFNTVLGSAAVSNQPRFVAATGVTTGIGGSVGFSHSPQYSVEGTGLFVTGGDILIGMTPIYNTGVSGMTYRGVVLNTPGGTAGAAGCMEFSGYDVADFTPTDPTLDFAFKSLGAHKFLLGSGSQAKIGTNNTAFLNASVLVDLVSTTQALRITRATTGAIATPATGMIIYDTGTGQFNFRDVTAWRTFQFEDADLTAIAALSGTGLLAHTGAGTWAERTITSSTAALTVSNGDGVSGNPALDLDADLTTIAGLTVAQGALIIGSAAPAWSVLGIGATDKYLRSNGTTAAWADVTELGLVDTYNSVATVQRGMPSIIHETVSTGNTANIALNEFFNITTTGWYRVSVYVQLTTVGTVSSTLPGANIFWVDGASGVGQSAAVTATTTANTTATSRQGDVTFWAQAGTFSIGYSTAGYAANAAASMVYTVRLLVEAL